MPHSKNQTNSKPKQIVQVRSKTSTSLLIPSLRNVRLVVVVAIVTLCLLSLIDPSTAWSPSTTSSVTTITGIRSTTTATTTTNCYHNYNNQHPLLRKLQMTVTARHSGRYHPPITMSSPTALSATSVPFVDSNDDDGKHNTSSSLATSSSSSTTTKSSSSSSSSSTPSHLQRSIGAILAASFLNLLGFTMAGPITPALGQHFGLAIGASFGSLTSAYPLGMLFGLLVWPSLSDKLGRKPVMAASLLGSGLGLAAQCHAISTQKSLTTFLLARAMTGAFAGSSPVSKAYLADVGYSTGKLPRYLALRDAASTMAFIVGPMLGGILFDVKRRLTGNTAALTSTGSLAFVIGSSAVASLLAALLVATLVVDIVPTSQHSQDSKKAMDKKLNDTVEQANQQEELISCPLGTGMWAGVASVCLVSFLFNVGDSTFHAFFSALLREGAGVSVGDIGLLYTGLACVSFAVSAGASSTLLQKWGPVPTCAAGLACVASGLLSLGVASHWTLTSFGVLAASASLYYCGVPLYGPTIPTMLLRCVPPHRRGAIMGLDGTINTIGRILSPLLMGDVYRRWGAGAAFGLAGSLVLGGALTAIGRRALVLRESRTEAAATS